jgi:pimeloyl-ACP methyl ester carboxylesterase
MDDAYASFAAQRARFDLTLKRGDRDAAMRDFVTFWNGEGAWDGLNGTARSAMRAMADKIALDWHAAFRFEPRSERLKFLADRTTIVGGDRSPLPMRRLVDVLHQSMAGSARVVIPDATHLLPLTHGVALTAVILAQLHADAERRLR